jgi:hypothetical protein
VRYFTGVVFRHPGAEVTGNPDVEMFRIEAFKNVDVFHAAAAQLAVRQRNGRVAGIKRAPVASARLRPSGYGEAAFATMGLA